MTPAAPLHRPFQANPSRRRPSREAASASVFQAIGALLLCLAMLLAAPLAAWAQAEADPDPAALLEQARKSMDTLRTVSGRPADEAGTLEIRKQALSVQSTAETAAAALTPQLDDVKARLAELGPVPEGGKESSDIASQRAQLTKSLSRLDSQIKLARLLAVEAEQAAVTALANRRQQFGARLGERSPPLLGSAFRAQLSTGAAADLPRLRALGGDLQRAAAAVSAGVWVAMACAVAALWAAGLGMRRFVLHLCSTRFPAGRLRRSLYAVGVVASRMVVVGLTGRVLVLALGSAETLPATWTGLLDRLEGIVWFAGFVAGLGKALLSSSRPSWRLLPLSDRAASRLRWFPAVFAGAIALGWISAVLSTSLDASVATSRALQALSCLTFILVLTATLSQLRRPVPTADSAQAVGDDEAAPAVVVPRVPGWLRALRGGAWTVIGGALIAWLMGYVALASFAINQLVWGSVVLAAAYLLAVLVDDLFMTLLAAAPLPAGEKDTPAAQGDRSSAGAAAPRRREQSAVLLSGLGRVLIGLFAVVLLMAPYGEGPMELLRRAGSLDDGLSIGEVSVKPGAVLQAVLVLVLGLFAVRLLKDWFTRRYMPTTRMDEGMRTSVNTLFGYVGVVVVVALSMSAAGVGLERVAWVASALSVGIGFGLQAVVQNFVSGLILLAERPVKVGDWVSLAGVEGDIRRINVRATEIQMGDRSTVIVPNSEFITKIVRNVTYTDPLGMVQIKLPMPLSTDTRKAREVLMAAFESHPGVLKSPGPNVHLDGIDGGNLVFNASGFVASPRASYGVRSDLLFDMLERLREAGLALGKPPTMVLAQGMAGDVGGVGGAVGQGAISNPAGAEGRDGRSSPV